MTTSLRGLLVDIIGRGGHQAVPVASAEEGLELLPIWTFQVAFIDQRLPGMEGLVLGQYCGQQPGHDDRARHRRE